jgi:FkbM family methyltransferase
MRRLRQIASWIRLTASLLQPFSGPLRIHARREIALRLLQGHAETISFGRNGLRWSSPIAGAVVRDLFLGRRHHEESFGSLLAWLSENGQRWHAGNLVINVGANVGDTAIPLARETGKRVIAVEPVASTFAHLQQNVITNGLESLVSCRRAAIASTPGSVKMAVTSDPGLCEVLSTNGQGFGLASDCLIESVECILLDSLASSSEIALVWSDTQGFETEVIQSGKSLWAAGVPLWVEVWPAGLQAHGGIDTFFLACAQHFATFISADALIQSGSKSKPEPTTRLPEILSHLHRTRQTLTDVLLLPSQYAE